MSHHTTTRLIALVILLIWAPFRAQADIILQNTFDGSTNSDSPFSTGQVLDANVTSAGVVRQSNFTLNGGFNALVAGELRSFATSGGAAAIDSARRYFGFDIAPTGGAEIDFDDFTYAGFVNLVGATAGPSLFDFRWSTDGFATNNSVAGVTATGATLDLSGIAGLQNVSTPVEFRLFIQSDGSDANTSSNTTFNLDEFTFNGTVTPATAAVPEPSSWAMMFICCAGIAIRHRRRTAVL